MRGGLGQKMWIARGTIRGLVTKRGGDGQSYNVTSAHLKFAIREEVDGGIDKESTI
jgi:hypothetical protein